MGSCGAMDLFLIRHGVTEWNRQKRYLGYTDISVLREELRTLDQLRKSLENTTFDKVYTSDLIRCKETLEYLKTNGEITADKRLRELNFGDWEGKTYLDLKEDEQYQRWLLNWEMEKIPGGETWSMFTTRIDSFLRERFANIGNGRCKHALIMTHGGVIRYLLLKFKAVNSFWQPAVRHGTAYRIKLIRTGGVWICSSLQEVPAPEKENS